MAPIREAATVCLVRASQKGLETLLLRRPERGNFPGMWVFPGGVVEDIDRIDAFDEDVVRRRAGVRETQEEAGVTLATAALSPVSRWCPPEEAPARFDTWMYLASVAPDTPVQVDGQEIVDYEWLTPQDALKQHAASRREIMPPTWIMLHGLTRCSTPQEAAQLVSRPTPESFTSDLKGGGSDRVLIWHGDIAYRTDIALDAPGPRHRMSIGARPWRYERTVGADRSRRGKTSG